MRGLLHHVEGELYLIDDAQEAAAIALKHAEILHSMAIACECQLPWDSMRQDVQIVSCLFWCLYLLKYNTVQSGTAAAATKDSVQLANSSQFTNRQKTMLMPCRS